MTRSGPVAALYVETNGCYFGLDGVDPWDEPRDARLYAGPHPIVAHPPCQRWGRYWHGSTRKPHQFKLGDDKGCFAAALVSLRRFGGVLEHPCDSHAWAHFGLIKPPRSGGWVEAAPGMWTCCVYQGHYGHLSGKATWLLVAGVRRDLLPELRWGASDSGPTPEMVERYGYEKARRVGRLALVGGKDKTRIRNATPAPFRDVLLSIARLVDKKVFHVVSVSGGKDSLATLLIALERCGHASVIPIFCDTGNEHEETYAYLDYLERALGIKIVRLKADFSEQLLAKRAFIAADVRTRREYDTRLVFEADGKTPVPKRDGRGNIVLNKKGKPVQKTVKVGGGRRIRWTNKAKRRALAVMFPSGNPFLDLCMWKGRFPSRTAQFCTEELKRNIAVGYQLELLEAGHKVISWQGVRRDESQKRANAKKWERVGRRLWIARPLVDAAAADVFALARAHGIQPNPLYLQDMSRVGCMPCINCNKAELRAIAARFPEHPERIAHWEWLVGQCSKRGFSTFMADAHSAKDRRQIFADLNIWARIEWSKTSRGGRQFNLLDEEENEGGGCSSSYGLCEQADPLTELEIA